MFAHAPVRLCRWRGATGTVCLAPQFVPKQCLINSNNSSVTSQYCKRRESCARAWEQGFCWHKLHILLLGSQLAKNLCTSEAAKRRWQLAGSDVLYVCTKRSLISLQNTLQHVKFYWGHAPMNLLTTISIMGPTFSISHGPFQSSRRPCCLPS